MVYLKNSNGLLGEIMCNRFKTLEQKAERNFSRRRLRALRRGDTDFDGKDARRRPLQNLLIAIKETHSGKIWIEELHKYKTMHTKIWFIDDRYGEAERFLAAPTKVISGSGSPKYLHKRGVETKAIKSNHTLIGLKDIASYYKTVNEFRSKDFSAYLAASRAGILSSITIHMERSGNRYFRQVYEIRLDETVYVGLSMNPKARYQMHKLRGKPVVRQLISSGAILNVLTELLPKDEAAKMETITIKQYRDSGLVVLNCKAGGDLGGTNKIWDSEDKIVAEAKKYQRRKQFCKQSPGAYKTAVHTGILEKVCEHMPKHWLYTKEGQLEQAIKAGKRPFKTVDLATGRELMWITQAECVASLGMPQQALSRVLSGKMKQTHNYKATWL
jgi:hypothetical protein